MYLLGGRKGEKVRAVEEIELASVWGPGCFAAATTGGQGNKEEGPHGTPTADQQRDKRRLTK